MAKTAAMALILMPSCPSAPAQVYMSEADALKIVAPQAAWNEEAKTLDAAARETLARSTRLRFTESAYRFQVVRRRPPGGLRPHAR